MNSQSTDPACPLRIWYPGIALECVIRKVTNRYEYVEDPVYKPIAD